MTIANNLIALAFRNTGIDGVGQTASAADTNDAFTLLNEMIGQWQVQRNVMVIPVALVPFPNLFTDQPLWTPYENVLLTTLSVRLRSAWGLPPDPLREKLAEEALSLFQANNQQQIAPVHAAGGLPTTCIQLIFLALRYAGRITDAQGVSDGSKDVADAFSMLAMLAAQWQRKRWLVPDLTETVLVATGALSYSVGPASSFGMIRPDRIESAFVRFLPAASVSIPGQFINNGGLIQIVAGSSLPTSPVGLAPGTYWNDGGLLAIIPGQVATGGPLFLDYPLGIIESREDYNRISLKSLSSVPAGVFYDSGWPTGTLYFWPVPPAGQYELHVFTKSSLPVYATVNDALNLPPEYVEALLYSLAVRIEMASGEPKPSHVQAMRAALNTVRMANTQIASLHMPSGLPGRGRGSSRAALSSPAFLTGIW